jgi:protein O-mannosyl-transferase
MELVEKQKLAESGSSKISMDSERTKNMYRIFMWLSALLTILVYLPMLNNDFVNWDDDFFISNNCHIKSINPVSLKWMATNFYAGFPIPIYWFSLAVDHSLAGSEPWIYHLDNLILHCLNTTLVFNIVFKILTLSQLASNLNCQNPNSSRNIFTAFGTSLLFGIHPTHVESVAWAAEQKDLLCGFFFLSCLLVYLNYATQETKKTWKYLSCLGLFYLALLSKPMAISLPLIIILFDYWPLKRFYPKPSRVLIEKIPFFLTTLLEALVVVIFQYKTEKTISLNLLPFDFRIMNSFHSLVFYLLKMLLPIRLAALYPIILKNTFSVEYLCSVLLISLISSACFIYRKKFPYLLVAWLFYIVTLVPVLGFIAANSEAAADRYTYLPCLGPFFLLVSAFLKIFSKSKTIFIVLATSWFLFLGFETFQQIEKWKDSISLWENVLAVNPENNSTAFTNMAFSYQQKDRWDDALGLYQLVINMDKTQPNPHCGKGEILLEKGNLDEAIQEFKIAMTLTTTYAQSHYDLGMAYEQKGLVAEALNEENEAIRLQPEFASAYKQLGIIYRNQAQYGESILAFQKARSLDPDNWTYFNDLVSTCQKAGKYKEELAFYQQLSKQ